MKIPKKILLIIVFVVVVSAAAGGWYFMRGGGEAKAVPLPPDTNTPEKMMKYFQSEQFQKLDPNVRRVTAMTAIDKTIGQRSHEYAMLPPEQREAYIDGVIDEMAALRQQGDKMRSVFGGTEKRPGDTGGSGQGGAPPAAGPRRGFGGGERMRARNETLSPEQRAERGAFFNALMQRAAQRGIAPR